MALKTAKTAPLTAETVPAALAAAFARAQAATADQLAAAHTDARDAFARPGIDVADVRHIAEDAVVGTCGWAPRVIAHVWEHDRYDFLAEAHVGQSFAPRIEAALVAAGYSVESHGARGAQKCPCNNRTGVVLVVSTVGAGWDAR